MKTLTETKKKSQTRCSKSWAGILSVGLALGLMACATTRQAPRDMEESGFLGDYSQLAKGTNGQAALVYIDVAANWAKYTKVKIDPIQLWRSEDPDSPINKMSDDTRQKLGDLLNTSLVNELQKDYELVDQAGPDVLVVRAAITDAGKSKPVIGFITSVYLPLKLISFGKQLLAGTGIGVGTVTIEVELQDGQTKQRLAAAVDRRSGTTAIRSKFSGYWGDVERSFDWWAAHLRTRLAEERQGTPDKTAL